MIKVGTRVFFWEVKEVNYKIGTKHLPYVEHTVRSRNLREGKVIKSGGVYLVKSCSKPVYTIELYSNELWPITDELLKKIANTLNSNKGEE